MEGASTADALAATLTTDDAQPPPRETTGWPDLIGKFQVERKLGEGGMGVVLLATDIALARRVALKLLRAGKETSTEGRTRFLREAQVMARLSHENVVIVHEVGEHEGRTFVAMEYVEGSTLTGWGTGKDWRAIVEIYLRAGRGLEAAHRAGLVHRDFKPDNVLVGTDGRVRVSDFGLAGFDAEPPPTGSTPIDPALSPGLTRTGALMGTPRFMAPEQHLGEPVDARADQFAFCVALYTALYDTPPYGGANYAEIAESVLEGVPRVPPDHPSIPASVRDALLRGLSRHADDRFPSMAELIAVLQGALDQRTVDERPRDPRPTRPRWLVPAIALGAVGIVTATVLALRPAPPAPPAPAPAAKPSTDVPAVAPAPAPEPDDDRVRIVIGTFDGDAMTDGIRAKSRPEVAAMIEKAAPEMVARLSPTATDERAGERGRAFHLEVSLTTLEINENNLVACKIREVISSYPERTMYGSLEGGGKVALESRTMKEIEAAAADCIAAVLDDMVVRQVLPYVRKKAAASRP